MISVAADLYDHLVAVLHDVLNEYREDQPLYVFLSEPSI
ncbi:hypothetical protein AKN40_2143 [Escherichia coli]|nr:hypothetical protein AKN40_2143 [Escherichia coli]